MQLEIVWVDYQNPRHQRDLVYLLDCYARDPMGGGTPLPERVRDNLPLELAKRPYAFSLICYCDDQPAGLINCLEGFSTFACRPLINIHDIVVKADYRGLGISQRLLTHLEQIARNKGCCKITLEVLEGNQVARNAYIKYGFKPYELDPAMGKAQFWHKSLE